ncbi:MAG: tRNA dihydrouridine synthase DusB [Clostridia bacterium]
MYIGKIKLKSNLIMAPMAGYTDAGFRRLCAEYGAGLTVTEMVSAKGLCYGNGNTNALLQTSSVERPVAVQIFGGDAEFIAKAVRHNALQKFDIIDINMGCPVPKIFKNGEGSALMSDIARAKKIVSMAVSNTDKPITVKFRSGVDENHKNAVEFACAIEEAGAAAITVHGRTREQFYSGRADWTIIKAVKDAVKIPVIANGDIVTLNDLESVSEITNCDGFMIGRAALGRPYIFSELSKMPYIFDAKTAILQHISDLLIYLPERTVVNLMKTHICYYAKALSALKKVRAEVNVSSSLTEIYLILDKYF